MKFIKNLRFSGKFILILMCVLLIAMFLFIPYAAIFLALTICISILCSVIVFLFFAKKSDTISKLTSSLIKLMKKADTVYIMGHKRPDFDSLGAAAGLFAIATALGQKCYIVSDKETMALSHLYKEIEDDFEGFDVFMPTNTAEENIDEKSLVIIADVNCSKMLDDINILKNAGNTAVVDHHATLSDLENKAKLICIDTEASSTSQIVTSMIENNGNIPLTSSEMVALLAGIIVDTNHFTINTDNKTMHAASYLFEKGADIKEIRKLFKVDESLMKIKARAVENAEHLKRDILISQCDDDCEEVYVAASQAANDLLNIDGIEASLVFYSVNGHVYVSGRSSGKIDMNKLLSHIGGGGHVTMAGARFDSENIQEAKLIVEKIVDDMYKEENLK